MEGTTYPGTVTPLRGLDAFTEAERDVFWGREQERDDLTSLVTGEGYRAGLLHGAPGVGKTSLLRAGLIPHLRDHGVVALLCDDNTSPAASLAAAYAEATGQGPDEGDTPVAFLGRAAASALRGQQFLFILDDIDSALASRDETIVSEIADLFARVVTRSSGRARFLFCCESEQLHTFGLLEQRTGSLFPPSSRIRLEPMSPEEAGGVFERMLSLGSISADPQLAHYVASQLGRGGPVLPADLQVAAMALRDLSLTSAAAVDDAGGPAELPKLWLAGAARSTGDERAALRLLSAMSQGRGKAELTAAWIVQVANLEPSFARAALARLESAGVVRKSHDDEPRYRLAHEVLAPRVRDLAAPARAAARRAFELLGSKAASQGRLGLLEWFEVRRQRLEPTSPEERAVIERTKRFAMMVAGLAVAIPLLLLVIIYITMSGHYYLDAANIHGAERVVVKEGRPALSAFNWLGFGDVVADTGFSRQMIADDTWSEVADQDISFGGNIAERALATLDPAHRSLLLYASDGSEAALDQLREGATTPERLAELLDVLAAIGRGGQHEVELVEQALLDGSPAVRISALRLAAAVEKRRPGTYASTLAAALASKHADQRRLAGAVVRTLPAKLEQKLWSAALERAKGAARTEILASSLAGPGGDVDAAELAGVVGNPEADKESRADARKRLYRLLAAKPSAAAAAVASIAADQKAPASERIRALEALRERAPKDSFESLHEELAGLADDKDVKIKAAALPLLARLDPESVAGDLAILIENKSLPPALRAAAALAWGEVAKVKRSEAITALEMFIADRRADVRTAAAEAYGMLGRMSQNTLATMIKKERLDVATGAAMGLVNSARAGGSSRGAAYGIAQLWKKKGAWKRRAATAYAELARTSPNITINYLATAARDKDDAALHPIGVEGLCNAMAAGSSRATRTLLSLLSDASGELREQIADCASDHIEAQPGSALQLAARLIHDSSAALRLEAAQVLAGLAGAGGEHAERVGEILGKALHDSSRSVRVVAAQALSKLGAAAPDGVAETLSDIFGRADEQEKLALLAAGRAVGATALVPMAAADPSERVRIASLGLALGDKKMAQASLEAALTDPSAQVRLAALDALAKARDRLGISLVERALGLATRDPDERIAARALTLLARVGEPKAVAKRLERLLASPSDRVRERAATAAAGLADTSADQAIALLEPRLEDPAHDVRAAAALSLGRVLATQRSVEDLAAALRRSEKEPARRIALAAALVAKARGDGGDAATAALEEVGEKGPPLGGLTARVAHGLVSSSADASAFLRWMAP